MVEHGGELGDDLMVVGTAGTRSDGGAYYTVHAIRGAGPAELLYEHHEDSVPTYRASRLEFRLKSFIPIIRRVCLA